MAEIKQDNTRNLLADIPLFAGLTPSQLDWVAQRAHRRAFPAGTNVLIIEQPGEAVYIILHGTVKIHMEQGGRDVILSILGGGDLLGEMSLIDSVGRSASHGCQSAHDSSLAHAVFMSAPLLEMIIPSYYARPRPAG